MITRRGAIGRGNLERSRASKKQDYVIRIEDALAKARVSGRTFTLRSLVTFVSERTNISESTFSPTRNLEYHEMLLSHLGTQTDAVDRVDPLDAPLELLRAQAVAFRRRLRDQAAKIRRLGNKAKQAGVEADVNDERISFIDTANLLNLVIKRSAGAIELNSDTRQIIDRLSPYDQRIVAGPPRTDAFFRWLKYRDKGET